MKSLTEYIWFELPGRRRFANITKTVAELVHKSGVPDGLCLVNAMHVLCISAGTLSAGRRTPTQT